MQDLRVFGWLLMATLAASLPITAQAAGGHSMGPMGGGPQAQGYLCIRRSMNELWQTPPLFEHIRIVFALRELKVNELRLSPACQTPGSLARWSLLMRNGENH